MKRSVVLAGMLALVAAGTLACSDSTVGTPTAGPTGQESSTSRAPLPPLPGGDGSPTSSETSPGGQGGPLAGTDPCVLSAQAAEQANVGNGTPEDVGEGRQCSYQSTDLTLHVTIFDDEGLGDVVSTGQPQHITVGAHEALKELEPPNLCVINIGTSETSRVDFIVDARGDQNKACQVATQVATAIEPSLPR